MTSTEHYERIELADRRLPPQATDAVLDVLDSGSLAAGAAVHGFESAVAEFCEATHGVATTSAPAALRAALAAVGLGDGDRVVTAAFGSAAAATAIESVGATPVFADIDPETYTLDPGAAELALREHGGDAVLVTHRYGLPADLNPLRELADVHDLALVENVAGALGVTYRETPVGALGDVGCLSFSPQRPITTGRGGMVLANSEAVAARARQFVAAGETADPSVESFRMDEATAALGRHQLDRLPALVQSRRNNATRLRRKLADTDLVTPFEPGYAAHAYDQFVVRCRRRDALQDHLDEFGIESTVRWPEPLHERVGGETTQVPVAEQTAAAVLSLPVHPRLSQREIDTVAEAVTYFDAFV